MMGISYLPVVIFDAGRLSVEQLSRACKPFRHGHLAGAGLLA
jgi:hypothetical protein